MIDTVFDELVDCSRLLVLILVVIERCYRTDVDVLCWFLLTTVKVVWAMLAHFPEFYGE